MPRRKAMKRSNSGWLLKQRAKEQKKEEESQDKPGVSLDKSLRKPKGADPVYLNPKDYKMHKRLRDIMADAVGRSSERLHKSMSTDEELRTYQVEAAKKAIRKGGVKAALRAWDDLYQHLLTIKDQQVKGIPLEYRAMMDFWHNNYGWRGKLFKVEDFLTEAPNG